MNGREELLEIVERTLDEVLPVSGTRPAMLTEAMRYALGSGGKRIRPILCLAAAQAAGGCAAAAAYPAAAIEILHNYTLVHDDLPAMDNDTLRRGRPTVWAKFGEANAILAGDALLALAFAVAARAPRNAAAIVSALGEGGIGVVQGQVEDLSAAKDEYVYVHKTGDLFVAAAKMGALAAGAGAATVAKLADYARNLGLAFQYEDDLLDGDGICGREETAERVESTTAAAIAALDGLPGDVAFLAELARQLVGRSV